MNTSLAPACTGWQVHGGFAEPDCAGLKSAPLAGMCPLSCLPLAGVGYGVGGLVGGAVYQRHGAQLVYWVAFAVMLAGWAMGGAAELLLSVCTPSGVHGRSYAPVEVLDVELAAEQGQPTVDMESDPTH